MNTQHWSGEAKRYDLIFNGIQKFPSGKALPMFSHTCYGTFVLNENETLPQAILRKQKQFKMSPSPLEGEGIGRGQDL